MTVVPFVALLTVLAAPAPAQPPDAPAVLGAVGRAREALRGMPALWGIDASGVDWVLVGDEGAWITHGDALEAVELPAGTAPANHAFEFRGRRVAMVLLPLADDPRGATELLIHEATHTFQPPLPVPGRTEVVGEDAGGELLDGEAGRTWLFLELRALAVALLAEGEARRAAARDALVFRARRDAIAKPAERAREDVLDLAEGLPEYTGYRLAGHGRTELARTLQEAASSSVSWVRKAGYFTGPGYGFVLDAVAGDAWHASAVAGSRLPALLAGAVGEPDGDAAERRGRVYDLEAIRKAERTRTREREALLRDLRARFVAGPVLRILPGALNVTFDPGRQVPLADAGTVMGGFAWASPDGAALAAPEGALVTPRWDALQVPLGKVRLAPGTLAAASVLEGPGWRLELPAGWKVERKGKSVEIRPGR